MLKKSMILAGTLALMMSGAALAQDSGSGSGAGDAGSGTADTTGAESGGTNEPLNEQINLYEAGFPEYGQPMEGMDEPMSDVVFDAFIADRETGMMRTPAEFEARWGEMDEAQRAQVRESCTMFEEMKAGFLDSVEPLCQLTQPS